MIRRVILMLSLLQIVHAYAATGSEFWKNCPGPACPARESESADRKSGTGSKNHEGMDREEMRKEREGHENATKEIQKMERRRDISR